MAVPIIMLLVLYRRSREIMFNIFASLTTSGMIFTVSSVLCLIFKTAQRFDISPQVYSQAFGNAVKGSCFISIIFGLLLTGISIFVNVKITKSLDSKSNNKQLKTGRQLSLPVYFTLTYIIVLNNILYIIIYNIEIWGKQTVFRLFIEQIYYFSAWNNCCFI